MWPAASNSSWTAFLGVLGLFVSSKLRQHALEHGQIGAAGERVLAGGEDHALDRGIARPASMIASSSSITSSVKTFIDLSGMSQVTSAMPSASTS